MEREWLGHEEPILIDTGSRPADTPTEHYSELSGQASPLSWSQARTIMSAIAPLATGLTEREAEWLTTMRSVAERDGSVPEGAERMVIWFR